MRDAIIIFIAIILAMVIGSYLFFNGSPNLTEPRSLPGLERTDEVVVLAEGETAVGQSRRTNYRIMNDAELIELWSLVYGTSGPGIPYVNFNTHEVIAVFDGSHSSGGYAVRVTDVEDKDGVRTVHIERISPGENCIRTEAITSPFQIIRVSKTTLPLAKAEVHTTATCH